MSQESPRTFSREFKVKVVERIEVGEVRITVTLYSIPI